MTTAAAAAAAATRTTTSTRARSSSLLGLVLVVLLSVAPFVEAWHRGGSRAFGAPSVASRRPLPNDEYCIRTRRSSLLLWNGQSNRHPNPLLASVARDLRGGGATAVEKESDGDDEQDEDAFFDAQEEEEAPVNDEEDDEEEEEEEEEDDDDDDDETTTPAAQAVSKEPVPITIRTAIGNELVDQVLELNVQRSRTVASLKESLRRQLPGKPPVSSMQLLWDGELLDESMTVHEILEDDEEEEEEDDDDDDDVNEANSSRLTLTVDMIPPVDPKFMTHVESRLADLTTAELLHTYCANEAALQRNAALLQDEAKARLMASATSAVESEEDDVHDEDEDKDDEQSFQAAASSTRGSTYLYLELRQEAERIRNDMQATLLNSEAARKLLEDNQAPSAKRPTVEIRGHRVRRPSMQGGRTTRLRETVQRNLNVNWADTVRYCVLFLFFGYFGGRTPVSRAILLLGAPSVFVLQARPLKLLLKQGLYALLDHPPGIFLSLLPAPQQVLLNLDYQASMELLYGKHVVVDETAATDENASSADEGQDEDEDDDLEEQDEEDSDEEYDEDEE